MGLPPKPGDQRDQDGLRPPSRKIIDLGLRIIFAVVASAILFQFKLDYLESFFYDTRVKMRPSPASSGQIEMILVDLKTVEQFKGVPTFSDHAKMLQKLAAAGPKAVVYTRGFAPIKGFENQYAEEDRHGFFAGDQKSQKEFAMAAAKFANFYVQTDFLERPGEEGKLSFSPPLNELAIFPGPKTADKNILAKDGITRRELISYQNQVLLHPTVAAFFNPQIKDTLNIRGRFELFDAQQVYIDFVKQGSFSTTKFEKIISGDFDPNKFKNKLVIVGDDIDASAKDYVQSPLQKDISLTIAELHANMFDTLIRNSAPVKASNWINLLFTILISIVTLQVVLTARPLPGILVLFNAILIYALITFVAFWPFGLWMDASHPFLAMFLCYYFFIPYRLIIENRRSWEYYQRNKLLSQVEELKTNFISMMSHDLKTPIARIQGMVEIILKDINPLSNAQREAVDMVKGSASDLLKFINSILNYAMIESKGVELHMESRDINQILQDVVKKHEFLAKVKHIKITTNLEPLFSIRVDPDLVRQVFSNLLENAIKYSGDNTSVAITSFEKNGFVHVQVQDHGPGISADELPNVFMKFFRSRNAKSSPIKGSGLGLYLAKYFIELHRGRIFVESTPGQGSVFTVELPT